uniref:Ig-like domain-containing protein n=1 Tax=Poecilia reticulata TaxID=8081 RepID=A0A3P9PGV8_POERE
MIHHIWFTRWKARLFNRSYDCLVPVVTVQLGEPVTLSCALSERLQSTWFHWYKQSAGDTLKFIVMQQKSIDPKYDPNAPVSRMKATIDDKLSNLTIMNTVLDDEGMYHCARMDWTESIWSGMYLTMSYTVLQNPVSDPARAADSETLQCSVISENTTCSAEPSMFWFRAITDKSYPDFIIAEGKIPENCEKTSNNQKKCSYNFSKNVQSSDAGTYYCAVAACGEILFGNGTKNLENVNSLE